MKKAGAWPVDQGRTYDSEHAIYHTLGGRTRAGIRRVSHAVSVLARFGLSYLLHQLDPRYPGRRRPLDAAVARMDMPERLRLALEELGPTAIKLGQLLSSRGDMLSEPYLQELRKLRDDVPPAPYEEAAKVIRDDLGADPEELFREFEREPRASASIGQVHFARLEDGTAVAVKVQREDVAGAIEVDLDILVAAARQAEKSIVWAAENHILEMARDFAHNLRQELNFIVEAQNTVRFRNNLKDDPGIHVPHIYWHLTTRRVLVVEWVDGAAPNEPEKLEQRGVDRPLAARNFAACMIRQILRDGYFHNDPHAGNVLFLGGDRLAFLDCGNAVAMDRMARDNLMSLLVAALADDPQEVTDYILLLGAATDRTDVQQLQGDVGRLISQYSGFQSSAQAGLGQLLDQLLAVVMQHGMHMQPTLAAIAKSLMVTEGVCLELDPDFHSQQVVREEVRALMLDRISPQRLTGDLLRVVRSTYRYAALLPRQVNQVLQKMQGSGVRLRIQHENIDRPLHRLDLMVNRIAFAIVVAAIIASSTNLVTSEQISGSLGDWLTWVYLFTGIVLGAWLLFSILRSGRL